MFVNTPPMGWNTWNTFGNEINEKMMLESVDAIVEGGFRDAGYEYVVIDDTWALKERDKNGRLAADPVKFPHGMKYIADYIHSRNLKFGMYSCAGYLTCAGYPGSYEHEWTDAQTFAEWEVDFLKYDFCFHSTAIAPDVLYKRMSLALANCGRDILFSACSWGSEHTRQWIKETGAHMWRSTGDIFDSWVSIKSLVQSQMQALEYNGRGCFNDMDMLVVGMNGMGNAALTGCTKEEYRTHFSAWALLNSPLMMGCDVRNITDDAKEILLNRDVIAINQDPLGAQPFFVNAFGFQVNEDRGGEDSFYREYPLDVPVLAKYLNNGNIAIGVFNFTDEAVGMWNGFILPDLLGIPATSGKTLELFDLWTGEKIQPFNGIFRVSDVQAHGCRLFRAKVVDA